MKEKKIVNYVMTEGKQKLWEECEWEEQIAIKNRITSQIRKYAPPDPGADTLPLQ